MGRRSCGSKRSLRSTGRPSAVEPLGARAVVVELDAVAVRVVQVDGDRAAVVGAVVDLDAVGEQPRDGAAELTAVGIDEGRVVEAGVPRGRRGRAGALERVQADVVVVVAGREEDHRQAGRAGVGRHRQPEGVAVEGQRPVQVGDAQMHVPDADRGVDGLVVHGGSVPARRLGGIGGST